MLWLKRRSTARSQARLQTLGTLSVLLCSVALFCNSQKPLSYSQPFAGQSDASSLAAAKAEVQRTGRPMLHHRHILATSESQLEQNVSYVYDNMFPDVFVFSPNVDLSRYDLLPLQGKCSMDSYLDPAVAECAATTQQCCFNANNVTVSFKLYHLVINGGGHDLVS